MRITNLAIRYRTSVVVLTILITVGGLLSYLTISKESTPSIEIPTIVVTTLYPGASPSDIESVVTQPIEQEVGTINGIDEMRSTSTEGVSTVVVEFTPDVEMSTANQDVREAVDRAESDLPDEVEDPMINEIETSDFPIMTVNLSAPYSLARLKEAAEDLQDEIEGIPSILEANLIGGLTREVRVEVDLNALKSRGLTLQDLINTIDQENTNIPGGSIDVGRLNFLVRVNGRFDNPAEQIENLVVEAPGGKSIYVRDVADVVFGFKDRETYSRLQILKRENADGDLIPAGHPDEIQQVISLSVKKRPGDNILDAVEQVKQTIEGFNFPSGTDILITGDQSEFVNDLVTDLENNIISGLIFVVLVLLFFLGVRNATLVGIAIPLSMFVSFLFFQAAGYTLNFIMLFSLIIALGMLVDNAIVIVENIYRYRENGYSRLEAARLGTAEVGGAVVASTATTVSAFAPMLFWPGIIGEFMGYLPLTLIVTLISSLFVAIIINPVITSIFVKVEKEDERERVEDGRPEQTRSEKERPRWMRYAAVGAIVFTAVVLFFASWETLVVLAVGVPLLYLLYTKVLRPIGDRFIDTGLPRLVQQYRVFLREMLDRDYTTTGHPFWRNMSALTALTGGIILGILGGAVYAIAPTAGYLVLAPAGLLVLLGLLGVFFHTFESLFLGGWTTVKIGGAISASIALVLTLVFLGGGITLPFLFVLLAFPLLLTAIGLYGAVHDDSDLGSLLDSVLFVIAGLLVMAAVMSLLGSGLAALSGTPLGSFSSQMAAGLMIAMGLLAAILAVIGRLYTRSSRDQSSTRRIVLTDDRAMLINSAIGLLFIICVMFAVRPTGVTFFPDSDPNRVQITLDAPVGTNVEASNRIAAAAHDSLTALLAQDPAARTNLENILVNVGIGGDAAFGGGANRPTRSRLSLNMVDYAERAESSPATLRSLRRQMKGGFSGVDINFTQEQQGPPTGPPVNIEISGPDFDKLLEISRTIKQKLSRAAETGQIPGLVDLRDDINAGRPEVAVDIDRERAAAYGLSTAQIAQEVRAAINGVEASKYRDGEDEYDITVRLREADRQKIESLENLVISGPEGNQIPLISVATLNEQSGLGAITRIDEQRVITLSADAAPGYNGQAVLEQVRQTLSGYRQGLPSGYSLAYTGENEDQQESFGFLFTALLIGVSLIFLVMIAEFNSVSAPFLIMIAVGLSLIGVMLGLILTRTPFSLFTFIGIIALAGIVVNNNIVLVDYIMQLRQQGLSKQEAIIEGGATRLRPVLLTALTTILGLIPLTFGINVDFVGLLAELEPNFQFGSENTQFWGPMGTAIISGLLFGTFLTLVIVPVMYSTFDSLSQRLARLRGSDPDKAVIVSETVVTEGGMATAPDAGGNGAPEATPAQTSPAKTEDQTAFAPPEERRSRMEDRE